MEGFEYFMNQLYEPLSSALMFENQLFEDSEEDSYLATSPPLVKMDLVGVLWCQMSETLRHMQWWQATSSAPVEPLDPVAVPMVRLEPEAIPVSSPEPEAIPAVYVELAATPTVPLERAAASLVYSERAAAFVLSLGPESIPAEAVSLESAPKSLKAAAPADFKEFTSFKDALRHVQQITSGAPAVSLGPETSVAAHDFIFLLAPPLQSVPQSPAGRWYGQGVAASVAAHDSILSTRWYRCSCITAWYCQRRRRRSRHLWDPHVFFNTGARS